MSAITRQSGYETRSSPASGLLFLLDPEPDPPSRRLRHLRHLLAQMRDPALRQSPLLGALDQVREEPAAGGSRLHAFLPSGHERFRRPRLSFPLHGDVDLL